MDDPIITEDEALIGTTDIILLAACGLVAVYYFYIKKGKKPEEFNARDTFTISPAHVTRRDESGFLAKMKSSGKNVVVFYGSQTGTAEEFAGRLAREANRWGMKGMIADPEDCDMSEISQVVEIENHLVIFCMATYGEGDPTDNAQEFFEFLQNGDTELHGLQYTVFGLGNKTYDLYNAAAKYVDKRLEELGAVKVYPLGLGDDDANLEGDFINWKEGLWPKICEHFGIEATLQDISMRQYNLVLPTDVKPERLYTGEITRLNSMKIGSQRPPFDVKNPFMSEILVNKELHKSGDRNCMHIELNIEGSRIRYDAGDHVAIYPTNDPSMVDRLCTLLGEDPDTVIILDNIDPDSNKKHPFPCPCTYRTALTHYVDIMALPKTLAIKELVEYTTDEKEKSELQLMSTNTEEGRQLYQKWVVNDVRNIIDLLEDMPSCKPPLAYVCELMPRLQARYYSISSSYKVHPKTIHITAIVLKYKAPTGRTKNGVCTTWLHHKIPTPEAEGTKFHVPIFVRKSQFRLPSKTQTPVLMIGPGTGIAPFRGFLQERLFLKQEGKQIGETILYFGCRMKAEDFIYEEELEKYVEEGVLKLHVAFSRDQAEKVYVQHLLQKNKEEVWKLIGEEKGNLYICGDAKNMARDVNSVIAKICQTEGGMSSSEADSYVARMITQKRYSSDVWS